MAATVAWARATSGLLRPAAIRTRGFRAQACSNQVYMSAPYISIEYEVHGIVQGVFFRAHTVDKARSLGLVGYVMNTAKGTVKGEVQGRPEAVDEMKDWLATKGSPMSHIERADFGDARPLDALEYSVFSTRRR